MKNKEENTNDIISMLSLGGTVVPGSMILGSEVLYQVERKAMEMIVKNFREHGSVSYNGMQITNFTLNNPVNLSNVLQLYTNTAIALETLILGSTEIIRYIQKRKTPKKRKVLLTERVVGVSYSTTLSSWILNGLKNMPYTINYQNTPYNLIDFSKTPLSSVDISPMVSNIVNASFYLNLGILLALGGGEIYEFKKQIPNKVIQENYDSERML